MTRRLLRPLALGAALASAAGAATGCGYFGSHDEVWAPIPPKVGEQRVTGTDTAYVVGTPAYELVAHRRAALVQAKSDLEQAELAYRRHYGATPPAVALFLVDSLGELGTLDTAGYARRGLPIVPVPLGPRRRQEGPPPPTGAGVPERPMPYGGPLSPTARRAAHAWVVADFERNRPPEDSAVTIPAWFEIAATDAVAGAGLPGQVLRQLDKQRAQLLPLRELFTAERPAADPNRRRSRQLEGAALFEVQAAAVGQFLVERGGPRIVGELSKALAAERDVAAALAGRVDPSNVEQLDDAWRHWLAVQAGREERAGR